MWSWVAGYTIFSLYSHYILIIFSLYSHYILIISRWYYWYISSHVPLFHVDIWYRSSLIGQTGRARGVFQLRHQWLDADHLWPQSRRHWEFHGRVQGASVVRLPSGELTVCNGKSPFLMGKSTIVMNFQWSIFEAPKKWKLQVYSTWRGLCPGAKDWHPAARLFLLYPVRNRSRSSMIIPILPFRFQPFSFKVSVDVRSARPKASWRVIPSWHWTKMAWANSSNWPWPVATARGRTWRWASVANMVAIRPPLISARGCWHLLKDVLSVKCAWPYCYMLDCCLVGFPERVVHWEFIGTVSS